MLGAILIGMFAGYLARIFSRGPGPKGVIRTTLVGVIGSLFGFFVFSEGFGWGDSDVFDLGGLPGAVIGTMMLLYLNRRLTETG